MDEDRKHCGSEVQSLFTEGSESMTDAEFWGVMAEMIEGAGCLPDYVCLFNPRGWVCNGLCEVLTSACSLGLITWWQKCCLSEQLIAEYGRRSATGYWWKKGEVEPRVAACRRLSELALANE
jgi:hypothetical protein